jgi:hypothetical protein
VTSSQSNDAPRLDEVERLRSRVAELEAQLLDTEAWANRQVAAAQDKVYWLDRWNLDLNTIMARPSAHRLRAGLRVLRGAIRATRKLKRKLTATQ